MNQEKNNITEGVIWKQILIFFFPILIGTFFQQLYNTVDALVVGRFANKEALAAVSGSAGSFINFVVGFLSGLSAGATVTIAQFYGSKDKKKLDEALHTAYAFAAISGILFGILGVALAPHIIDWMHTDPKLVEASIVYLRIYFSGLIFVIIYNIGAGILRAIGDSKRPLYVLIFCAMLNIILDLYYVAVLGLGVIGVAVATLISQAVSSVIVTYLLMKRTPGLQLVLSNIRIHRDSLWRILHVGLPSGLQSSLYSVSNMLIQSTINGFGVDTVTAWGTIGKIDNIIWMIFGAFNVAVTTFVGQNYGAKKWKRIREAVNVSLVMCFSSAVVLSILIYKYGAFLIGIFIPDQAVVQIGMEIFSIMAKGYAVFAFLEIYSAALQAEGRVMVPTIISLLGVCAFRVIWVLFIVPGGTLSQIIICYPMTWIICSILCTIYYFYKQKRIEAAGI